MIPRGRGASVCRASFLPGPAPPLLFLIARQALADNPHADRAQVLTSPANARPPGFLRPLAATGRKYRKRTKAGIFSRPVSACFSECLRLSGCLPHALPCLTFSGLIDPPCAVLVHALHLYSLRPIPSARADLLRMMQGGAYQAGGASPPGCAGFSVSCPASCLLVKLRRRAHHTRRAPPPPLRRARGCSRFLCARPVDIFLLPVYKPVDNCLIIHHLPCG